HDRHRGLFQRADRRRRTGGGAPVAALRRVSRPAMHNTEVPPRMPPIHRAARIALVPLVALLLALAGCGTSKVVREGGSAASRTSTPKPWQTVTVRRGDTLYRLAVNTGISPLDLAMWNGIQSPYTIYPGQKLRLYPSSGSARSS